MSAFKTPEGSRFYQELRKVIEEINAGDGSLRQTYRSAVVNGMGLADSFCGKIKSGQYKPSLEKIESLSTFLGVPPHRFTDYYQRYAQLMTDDPDFSAIFQALARMAPKEAKIVKRALKEYTNQISSEVNRRKEKAIV